MKPYVSALLIIGLYIFSHCSTKQNANAPETSYIVESIEMPEGLIAETGGLDFLPDGRLVACFLRGEVMIYDPNTKNWSLFAEGLHEPLGILTISASEMLVMQRPELTRIKDTDGDGQADLYEKVTDDFGLTGNYHEFSYGPVRDREGNLFIALNSASAGGGIRPELRGRLDTAGRGYGKSMFSVTPYRGWIMKLTPEGKLLPYAMGFRSPNGLGFDLQGNLFVTDNQGDWIGTSKLHHVQEGNFYGHPGALVWKKDWNRGNPFSLTVQALDSMRTKAAVLFPQDIIANSPTQPLCDITNGKFGPFKGQLFVGEMNTERIVRVILERIAGELQGACIPFIDAKGLRRGNNRLAFSPDGSLWTGQAAYGWGGDHGIQRIVFTGKQPADIYSMNLTNRGFDLTFTQPLDESTALSPDSYHLKRYYYEYHEKYGSARMNEGAIPVADIKISDDRKKISLTLDSLQAGYVYQLNLGNIKTQAGDSLNNHLICYTLKNLLPAALQ
ncbi:MAG: PQQ-dependent sugar dehydrogenase [Chitinophagaceae bacterium]|nr:PQQ-dependent sugar dehydrogenase [Chitinophagaceae bacterium]